MRSFMRFRQRRKVLLPHPEGPISAVISFSPMARSTPRSAWKSPYQKSIASVRNTVERGPVISMSSGSRRSENSGRGVTSVSPLSIATDDGVRRSEVPPFCPLPSLISPPVHRLFIHRRCWRSGAVPRVRTMTTQQLRVGRLLATMTAIALVAGACGSNSKSSSTSSSGSSGTTKQAPLAAATLNESGSTFQLPYLQEVAQDFKANQSGVTINVNGGGSGKGRQDLADQVVDFAAADGLPKASDLPGYKGGALLYFPTVAAPITLSYNVSGVDKLKLDADTI